MDNHGKHELISIIIPVFNVSPYLREALDSVVNQTYKNLEIIIVDDGSTDGSGKICDDYASCDPRFTVIHQSHQNLSVARNIALDRATGEYLAFLDSDDAYHLSFLQTMHDIMLREKCDIVICKYRIYPTTKRLKQSVGRELLPSIAPGMYNRAQALDGRIDGKLNVEVWNKLYKREIWNGVRFPPDLSASADLIVSFKAFFNCNSVYVIDAPLYLYRKRPGALTASFSSKIIRSRILCMAYVLDFLKAHSPGVISKQQIQRYDEGRLHILLDLYLRCSEKEGSDYLKWQIIDMADKIGIENCVIKKRIEYYMMLHCPGLLKHAYAAYLPIRLFVWKIIGR